jgi:hypothetical protein
MIVVNPRGLTLVKPRSINQFSLVLKMVLLIFLARLRVAVKEEAPSFVLINSLSFLLVTQAFLSLLVLEPSQMTSQASSVLVTK